MTRSLADRLRVLGVKLHDHGDARVASLDDLALRILRPGADTFQAAASELRDRLRQLAADINEALTEPEPVTTTAERASVRLDDEGLTIVVELRGPRAGEVGYWVGEDDDADAALAVVLGGRVEPSPVSPHGFGWRATHDHSDDADDDGTRAVTVTVTKE